MAFGDGAGAGTTGAGARLIICVNSLGPAAAGPAGAPPNVESGVDPTSLKIGGGKTPGSIGDPPAAGDVSGALAVVGTVGTGVGSGDEVGAFDPNSGEPPLAGEDADRMAPVAPPNSGAPIGDPNGELAGGFGAGASGGADIGLCGTIPGAPGVGNHMGEAGMAIGDGVETSGSGAAVGDGENMRVNSPGSARREVAGGAGGRITAAGTEGGAGSVGGSAGGSATGGGTTGGSPLAPNICVKAPAIVGAGGGSGVGGGATGAWCAGRAAVGELATGSAAVGSLKRGGSATSILAAGGSALGGGATGGSTVGGVATGAMPTGGVADFEKICVNSPMGRSPEAADSPAEAVLPGASSQPRSMFIPVTNSVTMAKPNGVVAVSSTRLRSAPVKRANCTRSISTS